MVLDWCGRAREDLQNNLRWQRGPVTLVTVRPVLHTGPRAGLLPAECFAQRNVTTVGKSLVRVGTVAVCCTVPVAATADGAAGRYRGGGGGGGGSSGGDRSPRRIHGSHGGVGSRGVRGRSVARGRHVRLRLDDHLRALAYDTALIVRHHECRVLLLRDAHVVASVGLLHYVPRPCAPGFTIRHRHRRGRRHRRFREMKKKRDSPASSRL